MTGSVEVKICGVCRPEDARVAAEAGASYIGVILAPGRSRTQTLAAAGAIFDAAATATNTASPGAATQDRAPAPAFASPRRVGVFVDAPASVIADAVRSLALNAVQLHGDESVEQVSRIRAAVACEVWKALRVRAAADLCAINTYASTVDAILLDGWSPDAHGGAGVRFDWSAVARAGVAGGAAAAHAPAGSRAVGPRLIVAGGLTPDNVAEAVALLRPSVVDVSSGVESAPGMKSPEKVYAFIAAARGARISQ